MCANSVPCLSLQELLQIRQERFYVSDEFPAYFFLPPPQLAVRSDTNIKWENTKQQESQRGLPVKTLRVLGDIVFKEMLRHTCLWSLVATGLSFPQILAPRRGGFDNFPGHSEKDQGWSRGYRPTSRVWALLHRDQSQGEELSGSAAVAVHPYQSYPRDYA